MRSHYLVDYATLLRHAYQIGQASPDPSTQNGALLVRKSGEVACSGFNRPPRGVKLLPHQQERPLKYEYYVHAEQNAIFAAAKAGIKTAGLVMVCPWACCPVCAWAIVEAGISRLVTHKQAHARSPDYWKEKIAIAFNILEQANIPVVMYDGKVAGPEIWHCGERWSG